jgi:hypothetical protein
MNTTININLSVTVPEQLLKDCLTTAVEGGIDYWAWVDSKWDESVWGDENGTFTVDLREHDEEDEVTMAGFTIASVDKAAGKKHTLNLEVVLRGIENIMTGKVEASENLKKMIMEAINDHHDSNLDVGDCDCIVQAGLFGDIVYG